MAAAAAAVTATGTEAGCRVQPAGAGMDSDPAVAAYESAAEYTHPLAAAGESDAAAAQGPSAMVPAPYCNGVTRIAAAAAPAVEAPRRTSAAAAGPTAACGREASAAAAPKHCSTG